MTKKLLVADDSLTIQKVIRLALSNEGFEIQAVSDGNDAVQQISLFRPNIVLIDVSLPGKSAFEVKHEVNQHADLEEVRFVLMSSAFEKVDEPQVAEVKFHGRLTKPFDPAHLRQVLAESMAQVEARRSEPTSLLKKPVPGASQIQAPAPQKPQVEKTERTKTITKIQAPPQTPKPAQAPPPLPTSRPRMPGMPQVPPPAPMRDEEFEGDAQLLDLSAHLTPPPPASSPFPEVEPEQAPVSVDHDDIKHLTESTIKMSGLDDFNWTVNEPTMKPSPKILDDGGTGFELDLRDEPKHEDSVPVEVPPPVRAAPAAAAASAPREELNELVRREVQRLLPEVAERIIREEIHRMLNERS